jgi:hypothetical protein
VLPRGLCYQKNESMMEDSLRYSRENQKKLKKLLSTQ